MLNTVRTPISRLIEATFFIAGWKLGANMNPIPISSIAFSTSAGSISSLTPSCSRTSALPQGLVKDRLPCFATLTPAAAITNAAVVLTLKVFAVSPPVPHVSVCPKVDGYLLDTCGTGGDTAKTFNVSTTAAFVIAAAGVRVAKHGNRSFTSPCGSADVLEQLGVKLEMEPALVEKAIEEIGIGFMFAPNFHPAMKNVASIRREIGVRTVFNILGPLTNPAGPNAQLIGVYESELLEPMCVAACNLGAKSVMTVYGLDGVDEISLTGKTIIVKRQKGKTVREEILPEDLGLNETTPETLAGGDPEQNARLTARILS